MEKHNEVAPSSQNGTPPSRAEKEQTLSEIQPSFALYERNEQLYDIHALQELSEEELQGAVGGTDQGTTGTALAVTGAVVGTGTLLYQAKQINSLKKNVKQLGSKLASHEQQINRHTEQIDQVVGRLPTPPPWH
jgi:hypothetical protein